jgi:hypothetical protein
LSGWGAGGPAGWGGGGERSTWIGLGGLPTSHGPMDMTSGVMEVEDKGSQPGGCSAVSVPSLHQLGSFLGVPGRPSVLHITDHDQTERSLPPIHAAPRLMVAGISASPLPLARGARFPPAASAPSSSLEIVATPMGTGIDTIPLPTLAVSAIAVPACGGGALPGGHSAARPRTDG